MMTGQTMDPLYQRRIRSYTALVMRRYSDNQEGQFRPAPPDSRRIQEKNMLGLITRGDLAGIEALVLGISRSSPESTFGTMSYNTLQQARYALVSSITLYCRAALDGGLPERIAYGLSDSLIQTVDELDSAAVGPFMCAAMLLFAEAVYRNRFAGHHPALRQCHEYIISHLSEPIRLEQLAQVCGRNPRYLSDLFQKELAIRPAAYIRRCKLEASLRDLENTSESITSIADHYAFPSASSYCAQFREFYGITPQQHRRLGSKNGEKEESLWITV